MDKLSVISNGADAGSTELLPAGHLTNKPELLFEKIEDDAINQPDRKTDAYKKGK